MTIHRTQGSPAVPAVNSNNPGNTYLKPTASPRVSQVSQNQLQQILTVARQGSMASTAGGFGKVDKAVDRVGSLLHALENWAGTIPTVRDPDEAVHGG